MDNSVKTTSKVQELSYELKIRDVMEREYNHVSSDIPVRTLRKILQAKRILGVPVVDEDDLVGIVSIEDFIKCMERGKLDGPIKDIMTKKVYTLFEDEPLVVAVRKFDKYGFSRFPVVTREDNKLVGTITKNNLIKGMLTSLESAYKHEEERKYRASHIFKDLIADDLSIKLKYFREGKNFDNAGKASTCLKKTLNRLGIPPAIVRRVTIATYEAEINLVSYTDGGQIIALIDPYQVKMIIKDNGPGIEDIEKAMTPGYSTAPGWVREFGFGAGMGLPNMNKFSDEMKVTSKVGEGTRLELIFKIKDKKDEGK